MSNNTNYVKIYEYIYSLPAVEVVGVKKIEAIEATEGWLYTHLCELRPELAAEIADCLSEDLLRRDPEYVLRDPLGPPQRGHIHTVRSVAATTIHLATYAIACHCRRAHLLRYRYCSSCCRHIPRLRVSHPIDRWVRCGPCFRAGRKKQLPIYAQRYTGLLPADLREVFDDFKYF